MGILDIFKSLLPFKKGTVSVPRGNVVRVARKPRKTVAKKRVGRPRKVGRPKK